MARRENSDIETIKDIPMKPIDKDDEDSDRRMVILAIHKMPKDVNAKLDRPFEKFELYDVSKTFTVKAYQSNPKKFRNSRPKLSKTVISDGPGLSKASIKPTNRRIQGICIRILRLQWLGIRFTGW